MKSKLEEGQPKIIFVGTDSFRLSEFKTLNTQTSDFSLIIPKVSINDIKHLVNYAIDKEVQEKSKEASFLEKQKKLKEKESYRENRIRSRKR